MADRIVTLLSDDALRQRLGRQAVHIAHEKFDLREQVDSYLHWFMDILSRGGA